VLGEILAPEGDDVRGQVTSIKELPDILKSSDIVKMVELG
jgi:hypothetical protein